MEKKIVFFDIDGTIFNKEKRIPNSTIEAIEKLKQANILVAIATGRAPFMFVDVKETLQIDSHISFNGSYVVWNNEVIDKVPLDRKQLMELEKRANELGHPMIFLDENDHYTNHHQSHPFIVESINMDLKIHYPKYDPKFYHTNDVYQALIFCEDMEDVYREQFTSFGYVRWHKYSLDVMPQNGSKAKGIEKVLKHLNISRENCYAFGDGLNDIEMLQYVGTGVAMGNGHDRVKACADFVTKSVDEDGIYFGLRELGLIK